MFKYIYSFLLVCFVLSCGKNNDEVISISGYTARDHYAANIGVVDETDWGQDAELPQEVWDILDDVVGFDLSGTSTSSNMNFEIIAYPNPCHSVANFHIESGSNVGVRFILVNDNLDLITSGSYKGSIIEFALQLDDVSTKNQLYRLYYTFSAEGNENFYFGHGDIFLAE